MKLFFEYLDFIFFISQTPRMWLFGYNETRQPLTIEETYEVIIRAILHISSKNQKTGT